MLAPYWTTYPEAIRLAGGTPVIVSSDETTGFRSSVEDLEAAWTPSTKALLFVSPSNPTGAVYPRRRDRGHRPLGAGQGDLGADRRDLRAPRLRRGRAPLHAGAGARAGRPLPGGQRRGQDLRHDRLARRVAHRADRRHRRRHQHPEPRDVQRRQRVAAGRAGRRVGRARGRRHDAGGLRPPAPDDRHDAQRHRRGRLRRARGRVLRLPVGQGAARAVTPGTTSGDQRGAGRDLHQRGQGGGGPRRGVRRTGLLPPCRTRWATTTSSRV